MGEKGVPEEGSARHAEEVKREDDAVDDMPELGAQHECPVQLRQVVHADRTWDIESVKLDQWRLVRITRKMKPNKPRGEGVMGG